MAIATRSLLDLFIAAKFLCEAAESEFRTADIQRTLDALGIFGTETAGVALGLSVTVGDTNIRVAVFSVILLLVYLSFSSRGHILGHKLTFRTEAAKPPFGAASNSAMV